MAILIKSIKSARLKVTVTPHRLLIALVTGLLISSSFTAVAQDAPPTSTGPATAADTPSELSQEDLAKLSQNPVSGLRELEFDFELFPDVPGADGTLGSYSLQLVWPFNVNDDWRLITYSILPVLHVPAAPPDESITGLGDTLLNFYFTPKKPTGNFVWGIGPAVLLPTRTESELGTDRYGLGPSGLLFYAKNQWSAGVVLQNVWSLGGSGTNKLNEFGAQYLFNYNLKHGWFLYSNSTITADWEATSSDRWTVPVGGGAGKIFKLGKQSISASFQVFSNVVRPDDAPRWGWNLQVTLLFPQ